MAWALEIWTRERCYLAWEAWDSLDNRIRETAALKDGQCPLSLQGAEFLAETIAAAEVKKQTKQQQQKTPI